ncbi:MAG: dTDP-4-dehydrorhamnose reductase [Blastocatellia bacterium]|jgi:dTDP-4-dehydrorhamnose reductase|nr:dTDP-4-dehydrorhamnose reductase [Blastocatellia bacterium]
MVGRAVVAHCTTQGEQVAAFDHASLDITDKLILSVAFERERPDVLINCAAWTDVDGCELDPIRAQSVNGRGPESLANVCRRFQTQLITISTDYVFDGEKDGFYTQRDQPNPQSAYGDSKLQGERRAQAEWARTIVVRSGYIFGAGGTNFLSTLVKKARRGEKLKAISDSLGTPTYAAHLAQRLYQLSQVDLPGTYHVVNNGEGTSFAGFARWALGVAEMNDSLLEDVSLTTLVRPAPRPRNSRLRCVLSPALGFDPLPPWQDAVREFLATDFPGPAMVNSSSV